MNVFKKLAYPITSPIICMKRKLNSNNVKDDHNNLEIIVDKDGNIKVNTKNKKVIKSFNQTIELMAKK